MESGSHWCFEEKFKSNDSAFLLSGIIFLKILLSIKANRVEDRCTIYQGDNRTFCPQDIADRVNLGLLPNAKISFETACRALKSATGGTLHIHGNVRTEKSPAQSLFSCPDIRVSSTFECSNPYWRTWCLETAQEILHIITGLNHKKWYLTLDHLEHVKSFAPHVDHLVLDLRCVPEPVKLSTDCDSLE